MSSANYSGIRARRYGRERVRREITVIRESDPDMPDETIVRAAPYEGARSNNQPLQEQIPIQVQYFGDQRAHAPPAPYYDDQQAHVPLGPQYGQMGPNHGMAAVPDVGAQTNGLAAGSEGPMTNPSLPVATDLDKMVHARDGELPSDYVSCPVVRSGDHGSYITFCVVVVALVVADVFACLREVANTALIFFGKAPQRCQKACRLIIDQRSCAVCRRTTVPCGTTHARTTSNWVDGCPRTNTDYLC